MFFVVAVYFKYKLRLHAHLSWCVKMYPVHGSVLFCLSVKQYWNSEASTWRLVGSSRPTTFGFSPCLFVNMFCLFPWCCGCSQPFPFSCSAISFKFLWLNHSSVLSVTALVCAFSQKQCSVLSSISLNRWECSILRARSSLLNATFLQWNQYLTVHNLEGWKDT